MLGVGCRLPQTRLVARLTAGKKLLFILVDLLYIYLD